MDDIQHRTGSEVEIVVAVGQVDVLYRNRAIVFGDFELLSSEYLVDCELGSRETCVQLCLERRGWESEGAAVDSDVKVVEFSELEWDEIVSDQETVAELYVAQGDIGGHWVGATTFVDPDQHVHVGNTRHDWVISGDRKVAERLELQVDINGTSGTVLYTYTWENKVKHRVWSVEL